jgi:hypothetical protein
MVPAEQQSVEEKWNLSHVPSAPTKKPSAPRFEKRELLGELLLSKERIIHANAKETTCYV